MNQNLIFLKKANKVIAPVQTGHADAEYVAAIGKNLGSLGYTLSRELFEALQNTSIENLSIFYEEIVRDLRIMVGAHKKFDPMYRNFPDEVMAKSDLELYFNSIVHYWSKGTLFPESEKTERLPLADKVKLKVIGLGTQTEFDQIFTRLIGANSSISAEDKEIVKWFVENQKDSITHIFPANIPQKEQIAFLGAELLKHTTVFNEIGRFVKTATDVLRIAVAMSDGDVSLADKTKFKKFKRKERRFLLNLLEGCNAITEDMLRYKTVWIKLGEILHPGEYKQLTKVNEAFDILRNDKPFQTLNGKVEESLKNKKISNAISLLINRPGNFARRLDHIFRMNGENYRAGTAFLEIADKVATPVLLQVFNHFQNRKSEGIRAFFPKGNLSKIQVSKKPVPSISKEFTDWFAGKVRDVLITRFAKLPSLGNVYLDPNLRNYKVPFAQRSASKALHTLARGSKINLGEGRVVRFFLWWKDGKDRTDIDLSANLYKKEWSGQTPIAYYNLKDDGIKACHSGDITSAPKGACEFIDIDVDSAIKAGYRYVVMCVNSYTQQPYCDLPECFAGWMMRSKVKSGEIFEAKTVQNKIDISGNTTINIPIVIDLVDRKVIWMDTALKSRALFNNVKSNKGNIGMLAKAIIDLDKPNLYDLLEMHAEGRGVLTSAQNADNVFGEYNGILTPLDGDKIISEYLA